MLPQREALLNMDYDFTSVLSRKDTGSAKWNNMYAHSPHVPEGVIPLSLADMELKNPPQIAEGVGAYLRSMNLGYTKPTERFYQAIMDWQKRRNGWNVRPEWIVDYPGVIPALFHLIRFLTEPGDGVILMTPVYYPFYEAVRSCGRSLVESELLYQNGAYTIDFDDLEKKAKELRNKVLLLCSPHNPVGRLWTRDELERIGDICLKHGVRIVSDEIHSDLVLSACRHIPIASLSDKLAGITITCNAPSKTFNLAGFITSYLIIPDAEVRDMVLTRRRREAVFNCNLAGYRALEIAYQECEDWLEELLVLLRRNKQLVTDFLAKNIPQIKPVELEATYLMWLDCSGLGLSGKELDDFMQDEAYWFTDGGSIFGACGQTFQRINIACPTSVLQEALDRLDSAVRTRSQTAQ